MDSITQAALGAAVTEAVLGRKIGHKAILWGLWFGTLPDLDILLYPWLDQVEQLGWHRGLSHSLLLMTLTAPLWGWLVHRLHRPQCSWTRASWAVWLALSTHVLIDCFTVYGTQVFEPFSDFRVGFNNLFIIDPLFTLPLLAGLVAVLFLKNHPPRRQQAIHLALALSTAYVAWSLAAKAFIHHRIETQLAAQSISSLRFQTAPTAFNTLLWRALVEVDDGYWIGYTSLLDPPDRPIRFDVIPRNGHLLGNARPSRAVEKLIWFSQGFFSIEATPDGLRFADWRFGEIRGEGPRGPDNPLWPIFSWSLRPGPVDWEFHQSRNASPSRTSTLPLLWKRLKGEPVF